MFHELQILTILEKTGKTIQLSAFVKISSLEILVVRLREWGSLTQWLQPV